MKSTAEARSQKTEVRSQKSEDRNCQFGFRNLCHKFFAISSLPFILLAAGGLFTAVNACELLVMNRTDLTSESKWSRYDIVTVKDDGFRWGKQERNTAKFLIIRLPGVDKGEISQYLEPEMDMEKKDAKVVKNRKHQIDITNFTEEELKEFNANSLRMDVHKLKSHMKEKPKK